MRAIEDAPRDQLKLIEERAYYKTEAQVARSAEKTALKNEKKAKTAAKVLSDKISELGRDLREAKTNAEDFDHLAKEWQLAAQQHESEKEELKKEVEELKRADEEMRLKNEQLGRETEELKAKNEQLGRETEELRRVCEAEMAARRAEAEELAGSLQGWKDRCLAQQTQLKRARIEAIDWYKREGGFQDHLGKNAALWYRCGVEVGVRQAVRRTPGAVDLTPDYSLQEGVAMSEFTLVDFPDDLEEEEFIETLPATPSAH